MMDLINELLHAPLANVCILAGLAFLALAVVGKISGKIEPGRGGRILAGVLGSALFVGGLVAHWFQHQQPPGGSTAKSEGSAKATPAPKAELPPPGGPVPKSKAAPGLHVVHVSLSANPPAYKGPCPVTVSFLGGITVANGPGQVRYQFVDEQGETGALGSSQFYSTGTNHVQTTRVLGSKGSSATYTGWEELRVLRPPQPSSARVPFRVECSPAQANQFRNFRLLGEKGNYLAFTVDYTYSGDHGSENIWAYGFPLQPGSFRGEIPIQKPTSAAVAPGEGTLQLQVVGSKLAPAGGTYQSSQVRVCMMVSGEKAFYCETFPYNKLWVFGSPAGVPSLLGQNSIRNSRISAKSRSDYVVITVDYTYKGDHGSDNIFIFAVPYQSDGSPVPGIVHKAGSVQVGDGQTSAGFGFRSGAGISYASRIDVCMAVVAKPFYCQSFPTKLRFGP